MRDHDTTPLLLNAELDVGRKNGTTPYFPITAHIVLAAYRPSPGMVFVDGQLSAVSAIRDGTCEGSDFRPAYPGFFLTGLCVSNAYILL